MGATPGKVQKIEINAEKLNNRLQKDFPIPSGEREYDNAPGSILDDLKSTLEAAKKGPAESIAAVVKLLKGKVKDIEKFGRDNLKTIEAPGLPRDTYLAKHDNVNRRLELAQILAA